MTAETLPPSSGDGDCQKKEESDDVQHQHSHDVLETTQVRQEQKQQQPSLSQESSSMQKELHIAPMLDVSKREFRKLFSILSTRCVLWTDMIVDETIANSNKLDDQLENLNEDVTEVDDDTNDDGDAGDDSDVGQSVDDGDHCRKNRVICQIGGNDPILIGKATRIIEQYGYDEINLNVDCPSNRVCGTREFGAILMTPKKQDLSFDILQSMDENSSNSTTFPISIKCRIGVDEYDDIEYIANFITKLRPVCKRFILHARKCILDGIMTARQNRNIPPLNYPRIYKLCNMFPDCDFWINGGIKTLKEAKQICYGITDNGWIPPNSTNTTNHNHHSNIPCNDCNEKYGSCIVPPYVGNVPRNLKGCMLGRSAMDNPSIFWDVDRYFYNCKTNPCINRRQVVQKYCTYLEKLYPRRCCDTDERITYKLPVPIISNENKMDRKYCDICYDMYHPKDDVVKEKKNSGTSVNANVIKVGDDENNNGEDEENNNNDNDQIKLCPSERFGKKNSKQVIGQKTKNMAATTSKNGHHQVLKEDQKGDGSMPVVKIAPRIIGRAIKPIRGLFYGLPKSKSFLRACDAYSQDLKIRNCGPGYILRLAIQVLPDDVLDQDFIKADEYE